MEAFHILREPFLYWYANQVSQVSTLPIEVLATKGRFTVEKTIITDRLIGQIEYMKSKTGNRNNKILFDTLFTNISSIEDIINNRHLSRLKADIEKNVLQHFISISYINNYIIDKTGITIYIKNDPPKSPIEI